MRTILLPSSSRRHAAATPFVGTRGVAVLTAFTTLAIAAACTPDGNDEDDRRGAPEDFLDTALPEELTRFLATDEMAGREEDSAGGRAARAELIARLEACGVAPLVPGYEQPITTGAGANILGVVEGTATRERIVLVSAHYDHIGTACGGVCNGALDNAAAVGAVVATACAVATAPLEKTLVVALWDAEEPPTFLSEEMGSQFFVDTAAAGDGPIALADIDVAVVLDLMGSGLWPGYGTHFAMVAGDTPALSRTLAALEAPLPVLVGGLHLIEELPTGRQPWSDYDAFRDRDVPALFLSDGQNKQYHEASDDVERLDFAKLAKEARYLVRVVAALSAAQDTFSYEEEGADLARDRTTLIQLYDDALAPGGMVDALGLGSATDAKLQQHKADLEDESATAPRAVLLESAAQYVMCLAGSGYTEAQCNLFF